MYTLQAYFTYFDMFIIGLSGVFFSCWLGDFGDFGGVDVNRLLKMCELYAMEEFINILFRSN